MDYKSRAEQNRTQSEQFYYKAKLEKPENKSVQIGSKRGDTGRYTVIHSDGGSTSNGDKIFNSTAPQDGFVRGNASGNAIALEHKNYKPDVFVGVEEEAPLSNVVILFVKDGLFYVGGMEDTVEEVFAVEDGFSIYSQPRISLVSGGRYIINCVLSKSVGESIEYRLVSIKDGDSNYESMTLANVSDEHTFSSVNLVHCSQQDLFSLGRIGMAEAGKILVSYYDIPELDYGNYFFDYYGRTSNILLPNPAFRLSQVYSRYTVSSFTPDPALNLRDSVNNEILFIIDIRLDGLYVFSGAIVDNSFTGATRVAKGDTFVSALFQDIFVAIDEGSPRTSTATLLKPSSGVALTPIDLYYFSDAFIASNKFYRGAGEAGSLDRVVATSQTTAIIEKKATSSSDINWGIFTRGETPIILEEEAFNTPADLSSQEELNDVSIFAFYSPNIFGSNIYSIPLLLSKDGGEIEVVVSSVSPDGINYTTELFSYFGFSEEFADFIVDASVLPNEIS